MTIAPHDDRMMPVMNQNKISRNVVCMKWGTLYDSRYVNHLYRAVRRNLSLPHRFICLTDDASGIDDGVECYPLPSMGLSAARLKHGGFQKIGIFKRDLHDLRGVCLFLDLDVVIVGSLDDFFAIKPHELVAVQEWRKARDYILLWRKRGANTSVFAFHCGEQCQIYDEFMAHQEENFRRFRIEQYVVTHYARHLRYWDGAWVRSFKRDCMPTISCRPLVRAPRLPLDARIVAFHGVPNPAELVAGGRWGRHWWRRGYGTVEWVAQNWR